MKKEIEKSYKEKINLLTEEEKIIFESVIFELSNKLRREVYMTGDKNLFLRNLKNIGRIEIENELTGEIKIIRQKSIMEAFKKFKKIRLLEMCSDGLPIFCPDVISFSS